jgi:protein involved in sex pheromone biosynthesis
MRAFISKVVAGSMIAGAALMISACQPKTETTNETTVTEMGNETTETVTDNMTAPDAATMDSNAMGNDTAVVSNTTTTTTNTH